MGVFKLSHPRLNPFFFSPSSADRCPPFFPFLFSIAGIYFDRRNNCLSTVAANPSHQRASFAQIALKLFPSERNTETSSTNNKWKLVKTYPPRSSHPLPTLSPNPIPEILLCDFFTLHAPLRHAQPYVRGLLNTGLTGFPVAWRFVAMVSAKDVSTHSICLINCEL